MEFGKLENVDHLQLSLPAEPDETIEVLKAHRTDAAPQVYVGCPVWGQKEWVGHIYPANAKDKDFVHYYAEQFNTIELNATFYNQPSARTVQNWKAAVRDDFRFCPKLPQQISQFKRLVGAEAPTISFMETVGMLEEKLGVSFLQLPHNFSTRNIDALAEYIQAFPDGYQLAIEFRDASWFRELEKFYGICELMEERGMTTVISDVAGRRDVLHMRLTSPIAFIRLTANDLHPSDYTRLDEWTNRLKTWFEAGLQQLYFFVHTHDKALNPELANYMVRRLNQVCGFHLRECVPMEGAGKTGLFD